MAFKSYPLRLGFLASHGGSNMQAILDAILSGRLEAEPRVVISNNSDSGALARGRKMGVPAAHLSLATHPDPQELDTAIRDCLQDHGVSLVVLAGYMRRIGPAVLAAYPRRMVNVHPALLPKFGGAGMWGMHVHQAVLAAGEAESGATIHLVDGEYDHGAVLAQARVPVMPGDTPQALAARVLVVEHRLYPETLQKIARGEINLDEAP